YSKEHLQLLVEKLDDSGLDDSYAFRHRDRVAERPPVLPVVVNAKHAVVFPVAVGRDRELSGGGEPQWLVFDEKAPLVLEQPGLAPCPSSVERRGDVGHAIEAPSASMPPFAADEKEPDPFAQLALCAGFDKESGVAVRLGVVHPLNGPDVLPLGHACRLACEKHHGVRVIFVASPKPRRDELAVFAPGDARAMC